MVCLLHQRHHVEPGVVEVVRGTGAFSRSKVHSAVQEVLRQCSEVQGALVLLVESILIAVTTKLCFAMDLLALEG